MATNIAALAYVSRRLTDRKYCVMTGVLYTLGRMLTYSVLGVLIILLGLELSRVQWSHSWRALQLSAGLRLLAGPLIGFLLAMVFGLQGAARQGNIVEASMPAAVTTTVLATEYGLDTSLVTAIVFTGTILSPLTLTPLLVFLRK